MVSGFNASCASGKTKLPEAALNNSPRDKAAHIGQPGTRLMPLYHFCKSFQNLLKHLKGHFDISRVAISG